MAELQDTPISKVLWHPTLSSIFASSSNDMVHIWNTNIRNEQQQEEQNSSLKIQPSQTISLNETVS
jgi:hypothetical protein